MTYDTKFVFPSVSNCDHGSTSTSGGSSPDMYRIAPSPVVKLRRSAVAHQDATEGGLGDVSINGTGTSPWVQDTDVVDGYVIIEFTCIAAHIPPEDWVHILSPATSFLETARLVGGSRMGLKWRITQDIVEKHLGVLVVKAGGTGGLCVQLCLPCVKLVRDVGYDPGLMSESQQGGDGTGVGGLANNQRDRRCLVGQQRGHLYELPSPKKVPQPIPVTEHAVNATVNISLHGMLDLSSGAGQDSFSRRASLKPLRDDCTNDQDKGSIEVDLHRDLHRSASDECAGSKQDDEEGGGGDVKEYWEGGVIGTPARCTSLSLRDIHGTPHTSRYSKITFGSEDSYPAGAKSSSMRHSIPSTVGEEMRRGGESVGEGGSNGGQHRLLDTLSLIHISEPTRPY